VAITFPVPTDATYDYVPVDGRDVAVGDAILSLSITYGGVTVVTPPTPDPWWSYLLVSPQGDFGLGSVNFPQDPGSMSAHWWSRTALWRQTAKPADAFSLTASDGSKWIYPAGEDGKMRCYAAGTTWARGDSRCRGALLTNPNDLWINDDPDWDWMPVADGSEVIEGDVVRGLTTSAGVVDEVFTVPVTDDTYGVTYFFGPEADGSPLIGYYLVPPTSIPAWKPFNFSVLFRQLPKPAAGSRFLAPSDGSRWIYTGGAYYCFGRGTSYAPGAVFLRGEIAGGLVPLALVAGYPDTNIFPDTGLYVRI
jgi:hypothetical protein